VENLVEVETAKETGHTTRFHATGGPCFSRAVPLLAVPRGSFPGRQPATAGPASFWHVGFPLMRKVGKWVQQTMGIKDEDKGKHGFPMLRLPPPPTGSAPISPSLSVPIFEYCRVTAFERQHYGPDTEMGMWPPSHLIGIRSRHLYIIINIPSHVQGTFSTNQTLSRNGSCRRSLTGTFLHIAHTRVSWPCLTLAAQVQPVKTS